MKWFKFIIILVALSIIFLIGYLLGDSNQNSKELPSSSESFISEDIDTEVNTEVSTEEVEISTEVKDNTELQEVSSEMTTTESADVIELSYSDRVSLKSLEEGKTYKLDLVSGRYGKNSVYNLLNDTGKDILIYSRDANVDFEVITLDLKNSFPKAVNSNYLSGIKTEADYVVFRYEILSSSQDALKHIDSSRLVKLGSKGINSEFKVGNIRYLYNDTDSVVEVQADTGVSYTIPSKVVVEFPSQGYVSLKRVR